VTNETLAGWLHLMIPLDEIVRVVGLVMPAFYALAAFVLFVGLMLALQAGDGVKRAIGRLVTLGICAAASLWFLSLGQRGATDLVNAVGKAAPDLNWLVVPNPGDTGMALDFTPTFHKVTPEGKRGSVSSGSHVASPAPATTTNGHPFHGAFGIMQAITEIQPHGAKCRFLQGLQHQVAAQAPLRAATLWSSNSQRTQLRAGALASHFRPRTGFTIDDKAGR
jgi:hypothetical protein